MLINPISSQTNFQAVNQKYYQWAKKEVQECNIFDELFFRLKFDVHLGKLSPQDAIDTLNSIEKIYPSHRKNELGMVLDYIKNYIN